jgi:hypothetical protein
MADNFMLVPIVPVNKLTIAKIIKCNKITSSFGLALSHAEAAELAATHAKSLIGYGRVEFGGGIINKIIMKFCDSSFLTQYNYAETLNDLIEIFYYFKNETLDEIGDDELISLMKEYFDYNCQGSVELLQGRELEALSRRIRYGIHNHLNQYEDTEKHFNEEYDDE